jgi:hypothetical protein
MYKKLMFLISLVYLLGLSLPASAGDLIVEWPDTYTVSGTEEYDYIECSGMILIPSGATLIMNDESDLDGNGDDGEGGTGATIFVDGGTFIMHNRLNMGKDHDAYMIIDNGGTVQHDGDKITVPDNSGGEHRIIIIDGSLTCEEIEIIHDRDAKVILGCNATIETCNTDEDDSRDPAQWLADGDLLCHVSCPNGVMTVTDLGGNCAEAICLLVPDEAWGPSPKDGAVHQSVDVILCWKDGNYAFRNSAYLGTDPVAVENATTSDPEWKGYYEPENPPTPGECVDPDLALQNPITLQLWTTYYWRVDTIHTPGSPTPPVSPGHLWSFTTGCALFPGDINLDCVVNANDYVMLADDWREEVFFPDDVQP